MKDLHRLDVSNQLCKAILSALREGEGILQPFSRCSACYSSPCS